MAKKIKFALILNDVDVRTLESLQENFDFEKVVAYFLDGKLLTWLEDRYYENEAEKIRNLDKNSVDFNKHLCNALGVEYSGDEEIDLEAVAKVNEKLAKLQQLTSDKEILKHAAQVAFSQEDLADLLDDGESTIYLCGKSFSIPTKLENRKYIGILGKPDIKISVETLEDLEAVGIVFENVNLPENLLQSEKETTQHELTNNKKRQSYSPSKLLDFKMSDEDRKQAAKFFDAAQDILGDFVFDIDIGSRPLLEAAKASNLNTAFSKFLNRIE